MFSKFGNVVDLRICSKSGARPSGGRSPPNYGFIIYDDPESVQTCLAHTVSYLKILFTNFFILIEIFLQFYNVSNAIVKIM